MPSQSKAAGFVKASAFGGFRDGCVFKMGSLGLGYYRDTPPRTTQPPAAAKLSAAEIASRIRSNHGSEKQNAATGRGYRFGGDNRERTFRAYCERALSLKLLAEAEVDRLRGALDALPDGEREREMLRIVEAGMRGREVSIVGATGRTSRGWWGDGTVGLLLPHGLFDERRPELLPVRVPLRSAALGANLHEAAIAEVMDVGINLTNLRLRQADAPAASTHVAVDISDTPATHAFPESLKQLYSALAAEASSSSHSPPSDPQMLSPILDGLRHHIRDGSGGGGNRLVVERPGKLPWMSTLEPNVHRVRLSLEHLWSGAAKARLISRCCQLDLLQCMTPLSAWPGQGPPSDYVVNVGPCTRAGEVNPQLEIWHSEARDGNADFRKIIDLKAALIKRGVRLLSRFDSLFMRLYAARAVIPAHRDEGRRRIRIVGNSGKDRSVHFLLQAIGEHSCSTIEGAERLSYNVEHGWAYALTDIGAGRLPLTTDVDASDYASSLPGGHAAWRGLMDLVVAHEVQPTSNDAPITMAWVVDLDPNSCGGDVSTIIRRYEEAVLEVMLSYGVSLDEAMEPPLLPTPFLYRPFEAGTPSQTARPTSRDKDDGEDDDDEEDGKDAVVNNETRFLLRVCCCSCGRAHWLPAQEGQHHTLVVIYPQRRHEKGCPHARSGTPPLRLVPTLRKVGDGYKLKAVSGGEPELVEVAVATAVCGGGAAVSLKLSLSRGPHAYVTEIRSVE